MSIQVNMNMFPNLDGQVDSDGDEEEDGEKFIMQAAYAAGFCALFSAARYLQTRYNFVCPPDTMKFLSSAPPPISLPTSDDNVHPRKRAHWTTFEEAVLIQFLFERKNEMTARAMFKDSVFKRAAKALNRFHEKGARKTSISCRSKWTRVCISFST